MKRLNSITAAAKRAEAALLRLQNIQINTGAAGVVGGAKNAAKNAKKTTNQPAAAVAGGKKTSAAPSASKASRGVGANYRKTGYYPPVMGNVGGAPTIMPGPQRPTFSKAFGGTYKPRAVKQPRSVVPKNASYRMLGPAMIDSGGLGAVSMLKGMGIMYGLTGLGAAIGSGISDYADYNNLMTTAKAILGSHDHRPNFEGRFKAMQRLIRDIGMETKFTAPEVADAAKYLAMAGFDIDAINKTMRPITNMALVADSDLGETADVVTNIMTSYQMKPEDMQYVADNLTMAFTMSNTTLMEMAEAYKYFGNLASAFGTDFRETAAMVGLLGDAGLKGSHAGTTIRQIFNNILNPNKKQTGVWKELGISPRDANGKLRPMMDIFSDLAQHGALEKAFKMFRITASQGAVRLIQDQLNTGKWQRMYAEMLNSEGISDKIAQSRIENLKGQWAQVASVFRDRVMIAMEAFEPEIKSTMKNLVSWLKSAEGTNFIVKFTNSIFELMKAIGEISKIFLGIYNKMTPFINFWLKWQMILSAILIPLRIVKGLMNFFLGGAMYAMKIGRVTTALTGLRSVLTQGGGWRAAGSSFISTMRGVANSAETASASVVASTYAMPKYYNANGKKTPLGTLRFGLMPGIDNEKIKVRNYLQSRVFAGYGDDLRSVQDHQQRILRNNEKMAKIANRSSIGNFLRYGRSKSYLLNWYQKSNSYNRGWIDYLYNSVKPYQDPRLGWGGKLGELRNAYKTLRKVRGTRVEKAIRGQIAKTGAQLRAEIAAYDMSMKEWEKARAMAYGGSAFFGKPGSNQNNGTQTASLWKKITHPRATQRALRLQRMRNATLGVSRWDKMKNYFRNNPNTANALAGGMSMGLGLGGGMLGAEYGQGDYSAMIWGGLGAMAPMLIAGGPVGIAVGVAAAIGGIAYELTQVSKRANEAKEALSRVGDSFRLEHGFVAGSAASDLQKRYQLMYDSNLDINDAIRLRIELLRKELGLTSEISQNYDEEKNREETNNAFSEYYKNLNDLTSWLYNSGIKDINGIIPEYNSLLSNMGAPLGFKDVGGSDYVEWSGLYNKAIKIFDPSAARMIASAAAAGFQNKHVQDKATEFLNQFNEAIKSGDEAKIAETFKAIESFNEGFYKSIPRGGKIAYWNFKNENDLLKFGVANTEPYRQGQIEAFRPTFETVQRRLNSYKALQEAAKSGFYTPSNVGDYFNVNLEGLMGIDFSRFNGINDSAQLKKMMGFHPEDPLHVFQDSYVYDKSGNLIETIPAIQNAKMVVEAFGKIKDEWEKMPAPLQKVGQEFFDFYKYAAEQASAFISRESSSLFDGVKFSTQPQFEITESNGHINLDVILGKWKKTNSNYNWFGPGTDPIHPFGGGGDDYDDYYDPNKSFDEGVGQGVYKRGQAPTPSSSAIPNGQASVDQRGYRTSSYWTNGSQIEDLTAFAKRDINVSFNIHNINGHLNADDIAGMKDAMAQAVVDIFTDIPDSKFGPVDKATGSA